ncbi:MAG TPA: SDR family oxidoreductase [Chloroflexota bacterium]|nr:SDR family oxidoreductase [Chloroflexota bacterium]
MTDSNRVAVITGGSRGLGRALAAAMSRQGWSLIITGRDVATLEAARSRLSTGTTVVAISGDISNPVHRDRIAAAVAELGGVDVVVNNASILGPSPLPRLLDYPLDDLERVYRVNTAAPLALLQSLRSAFKPGARILNITSDAGLEAYEGWGGYGSSKAALEQISNVLATENPELRVYWVDPGDMRTDMHQEAFPDEDISDRPPPEESVPGLLRLIAGDLASGRYRTADLQEAAS